jgi:hypothetical protein
MILDNRLWRIQGTLLKAIERWLLLWVIRLVCKDNSFEHEVC